MGTVSTFAATGSGTVPISFRGNGSDAIDGWIGGIAGTTWKTTAKYTVTIDPDTSEKPVTTYLTFRKKSVLSHTVLDTTYFNRGVKYGNTSETALKSYSKTIM